MEQHPKHVQSDLSIQEWTRDQAAWCHVGGSRYRNERNRFSIVKEQLHQPSKSTFDWLSILWRKQKSKGRNFLKDFRINEKFYLSAASGRGSDLKSLEEMIISNPAQYNALFKAFADWLIQTQWLGQQFGIFSGIYGHQKTLISSWIKPTKTARLLCTSQPRTGTSKSWSFFWSIMLIQECFPSRKTHQRKNTLQFTLPPCSFIQKELENIWSLETSRWGHVKCVERLLVSFKPSPSEVKEIFKAKISLPIQEVLAPFRPPKTSFFQFLLCGSSKPKRK